jgi:hypothetical protein
MRRPLRIGWCKRDTCGEDRDKYATDNIKKRRNLENVKKDVAESEEIGVLSSVTDL